MTLNELNVGECASIVEIDDNSPLFQRFLDLGIVSGMRIECTLISPGMNPKAYMIRGALIAIRNEDAKFIKVERSS